MTWTLPENPSNLLIQGTFVCATKNLDVVSGFRSLSQELVLYVVTPRASEKAPSDESRHNTPQRPKARGTSMSDSCLHIPGNTHTSKCALEGMSRRSCTVEPNKPLSS